MRTLLNVQAQNDFLSNNWRVRTVSHKYSCRGYGNSKMIDNDDNVLSRASGCGYDRYGTVIGSMIEVLFPVELNRLAKRFCKEGKRNATRKGSKEFYGMFYNAKTKQAYLDGACGNDCMYRVLNAIGFELEHVAECRRSNDGEVFYRLLPVSAHNKKYVLNQIK